MAIGDVSMVIEEWKSSGNATFFRNSNVSQAKLHFTRTSRLPATLNPLDRLGASRGIEAHYSPVPAELNGAGMTRPDGRPGPETETAHENAESDSRRFACVHRYGV
ncbi:hypothetical protein E4U54_003348 [Claviceps lovelessii]|nr:hypothetical protein E4U54_003348 [Claviceps lovelessii]